MKEKTPELINPEDVTLEVLVIEDDDCTPCQQVKEHLKKYPGKVKIIDPLSPEAEKYWENDEINYPAASIKTKDGKDTSCEVFMDENNLVMKCGDKILVVNEPPREVIEDAGL